MDHDDQTSLGGNSMEENDIKSYLDSHETIQFQVTREELDDPKKSARYFALLDYFGAHPQEAGKFCSRLLLVFHPSCGTDLWENEAAAAFVKRLTAYPYLFFLAERKGRP